MKLNEVLFEETFLVNKGKFEYFFDMLLTMFVELDPAHGADFRTLFESYRRRIDQEITERRDRLHQTLASTHVEAGTSWLSYKHTLAAFAEAKNQTLHGVLQTYCVCIKDMAKELFAVVPNQDIINHIYMRAREMMRYRFHSYTLDV